MRAVIDTNIFMSALINRSGAPAKILRRWRNRQFILVISAEIEFEYTDVLLNSTQIPAQEVQVLLKEVRTHALIAPITGTLHVCKDPDDDIFLEAAIAGSAAFLVTKNLNHFPKKSYQGIKIVKVSAFLRELEKIAP